MCESILNHETFQAKTSYSFCLFTAAFFSFLLYLEFINWVIEMFHFPMFHNIKMKLFLSSGKGASIIPNVCRSVGRSVGRSVSRPVGRSDGLSVGLSV